MTITLPPWQPLAGPHNPVAASPPRPPGSVRRTTSLDMPWPDYDNLRASLHVRGRDLRTSPDGDRDDEVLGTLEVDIAVEVVAGRVEAVDGRDAGSWDGLLGLTLRSGFGKAFAERHPDDAVARSLGFSALDDLNGAFLVSGYSMIRNGMMPENPERGAERAAHQADVCAGWAVGSPVYVILRDRGTTAVPYGPVAPPLDAFDPEGWHDLPVLEHRTVRRQRQLDVARRDDGGLIVHSHFRDAYAAEDHAMVMHEYLVQAAFDADGRLVELHVDPRVLPWSDCPGAVASAQRLVGCHVDDLSVQARTEMAGPIGCTHLTSTLRALADVRVLAAAL